MDFEISRKKHVSRFFYILVITCIIIGGGVFAIGIIEITRKDSLIPLFICILGGVLVFISLALLVSQLMIQRSYRTADIRNKEFMLKTKPIRIKCFGTRERNHRKYGYDWQIVVMHNFEYFYTDWLFGYSIDNEDIENYYIDLYIIEGKYYLDINSLCRGA